jgi:hypothetical protein
MTTLEPNLQDRSTVLPVRLLPGPEPSGARQGTPSGVAARFLIGFGAGAISHVVFQGALGAGYFAAGLIPALPWSLEPLPPFGVPRTVNFAFWAGLWGIVYAGLEPRLTAWFGRLGGGLAIGIAAMLVRWFVVLPLQGAPVVEGFVPRLVLVFAGFHLVYGLGLATIFGAALRLAPSLARVPAARRCS